MKKSLFPYLFCAALFAMALPLHAQQGCVNSPENPTVVLALAGSAGGLFAYARTRFKARRKAKQL